MLESLFRYSCKLKACCFILTLSKLIGGGWKFSKNIFSRERDFWTYEDFPVLTIFVNYLGFLTFSCYKNTSHMILENRSIRRAVFCKNNLLQDLNKFHWKVSVMESLFSKTVKKDAITGVFMWICSREYIFSLLHFTQESVRRCSSK